MKRCGGSQTDQGEVLNNCCYITFTLGTLCSDTLLQLPPFSDSSLGERGIVEKKWKSGEKPPNPMRKTEEDNRETTKNILTP